MADYDYDIGVIGGGAAGLTVASGASQLGLKTFLIEKEAQLGGDCLHFGCVPSKTLIKSASIYHKMKTADAYGLPSVDLPPVDFKLIAKRIQSVIDVIQVHDSEERFCRLGVEVGFGDASFVDEHVVLFGKRQVSARFWVIATGSEPATLPVPGLDQIEYLTNKTLFSLDELPQSLIVLGGGPIGCEMAQAFARLGTEVTILQRNSQLLSAEDEDMAAVIQTALSHEGVHVSVGTSILGVHKTKDGIAVEYERAGQSHTVVAAQLLVAAGRTPNVSELKLENAGVEFDTRGVITDNRLRTSQKHIFAAGDVLGKHQFTHAAGYEGGIIVSNVVFRLPRKVDYTWLPWCTYTEPELASVGMNEKSARKAGMDYSVWEESFAENDRALAEGATEGKIKLILDRKEKPLGVQIVGAHAGELVAEWVATLNGGVGLSTLAAAMHPYPTVGEINKRVAGNILSKKIFSDKVRKTLGFIFDYKGRACTLD